MPLEIVVDVFNTMLSGFKVNWHESNIKCKQLASKSLSLTRTNSLTLIQISFEFNGSVVDAVV